MNQNVVVKVFAGLQELLGSNEVTVEVPEPSTVGQLRQQMVQQFETAEPLLERSRFAVNDEYASDDVTLSPNDEIACIPPVSGG